MPILVVRSVAGVTTESEVLLTEATLHHRPAGKGRDKRLLAQLDQALLDLGVEKERGQAFGLRALTLAYKAGVAERLAQRALNALVASVQRAASGYSVVKRVIKALRSAAVKA